MSKAKKNTDKTHYGAQDLMQVIIEEARAHGRTQEQARRREKRARKQLREVIKLMNREITLRQEQILLGKKELAKADGLIETYLGIILDLAMQIGCMNNSLGTAKSYQERLEVEIQKLKDGARADNETIVELLEEINKLEKKHRRATEHVQRATHSARVRRKKKPKQKKKKKKGK